VRSLHSIRIAGPDRPNRWRSARQAVNGDSPYNLRMKATQLTTGASTVRRAEQSTATRRKTRPDRARITVERILACAQRVLVQKGYGAFSMRLVATETGISVGNLQYHFRSKRELIRAIVHRLTTYYSDRFEKILVAHRATGDLPVEELVRYALTEAVTPTTVRTFRELWALANHDAAVRRVLDDFYEEVIEGIVATLGRACPAADLASVRDSIYLMTVLSEGCLVVYGTRRSRAVPHDRLVALAAQLLAPPAGAKRPPPPSDNA
jgi:AcrR family transcriptional regulator